jgi:hypothetical protein
MKPEFDIVWSRIKSLVGQQFTTKTNLPFSFLIQSDILLPSRTEYNISKKNFRIAYEIVPYEGPGILNRQVRGPTYVWAILHDRRVRGNDW